MHPGNVRENIPYNPRPQYYPDYDFRDEDYQGMQYNQGGMHRQVRPYDGVGFYPERQFEPPGNFDGRYKNQNQWSEISYRNNRSDE